MKIAVPREVVEQEKRVALIPGSIERLVKQEFEVVVESGAGGLAGYTDEQYQQAGAAIAKNTKELYKDVDVILKVRPPLQDKKHNELKDYPKNAVLISYLDILIEPERAKALADQQLTSFAMETIPRISRAQSMDALSSQASAAGYKALLIAAEASQKFLPMLTTAAGTIPPAKVLVLGAGVAGLQAIATAKRLGANVEGFDIRPAAKGEVESLGAKFIDMDLGEDTEAGGGYAKELSEESKKREHEILSDHVAAADIVITTAAVPGKKAPVLVTKDMVDRMQPGSVVVDMAVEQGGNVEGTQAGERIDKDGVLLIGPVNLPSKMAIHTSRLYAKNVTTLLNHLVKDGKLELDFEDEITAGCCITHEGQVVHEKVKELLNA